MSDQPYNIRKDSKGDHAEYDAVGSNDMKDGSRFWKTL